MIRFSRNILLILILLITFSGCSKKTNGFISRVQNESVLEYSVDKVAVISIDDIPPLKEGTRVEIGWASAYVRYNGRYYQITLDKVVKKGKAGKQIGKVERTLPSSMVLSKEKFIEKDGDSNYLPEGSVIYAFKVKTAAEAIIVDDKGIFREAIPDNN